MRVLTPRLCGDWRVAIQMSEAAATRSAPDCGSAQALIAIARDRDKAAFAELFQTYAPKLKGYLLHRRVSEAVAEELAQDALLTVWRKADRFNPEVASASAWIFTIARNVWIDDHRRNRRPEPTDILAWSEGPATPEQDLNAAQDVRRVGDAIASLLLAQASVLHLAFFEERTHSDIAAHLSLPVGTVKGRIRLSATKLRALLGDHP